MHFITRTRLNKVQFGWDISLCLILIRLNFVWDLHIAPWRWFRFCVYEYKYDYVHFYRIAILKSLSFILRRQYFVVFTSQIQCFDWLIRVCFDSLLFSQPIKIDYHFKVKRVKNKVNTFWTISANFKSWKIFIYLKMWFLLHHGKLA